MVEGEASVGFLSFACLELFNNLMIWFVLGGFGYSGSKNKVRLKGSWLSASLEALCRVRRAPLSRGYKCMPFGFSGRGTSQEGVSDHSLNPKGCHRYGFAAHHVGLQGYSGECSVIRVRCGHHQRRGGGIGVRPIGRPAFPPLLTLALSNLLVSWVGAAVST